MFRIATHDPRRHLIDWLAAMNCVWYPVELDPELNPSLDPRALLAAQCKVGTQTVLLQHDLDNRPDHARVICVLGPLPRGGVVPMLLRLLQANLIIALRGSGAVLGLEAGADAVCLTDELSLAEGAEEAFRVRLHHLASQVERWQEGRLFADAGP
ncbi:MAG TPA: hypothetical protein VLG41_11425 [Hydrogenophaga sp.]|nr:hypothetical protein [Hydrogenophaga sp.]